MKKLTKYHLGIEIDKLTNSIVNTISGISYPTDFHLLAKSDLKNVSKKNGWLFNWANEFKPIDRKVFKLTILNNPDIILADEPTGNLDPETSDEIVKLFIEIKNSGKTVIMATHDYSLFKRFTARTLKVDNGMVLDSKLLD